MAGEVFWVTFLAGVGGTGLGGVAGGLFRRESERTVSLLLSFAAGVMVAVVCFDLLAEAAAPGRLFPVAAGILAGYGVTAGLGYLLERRRRQESRLLLAGLVMGAAIALHNLPPEAAVAGPWLRSSDCITSRREWRWRRPWWPEAESGGGPPRWPPWRECPQCLGRRWGMAWGLWDPWR